MDEREKQFRNMAAQFPDSPIPQFTLGRYLLEAGRFGDAVQALEAAVAKEPTYAAALLSLGDAYAALDEKEKAKEALARCAEVALAQHHPSLAQEARERAEDL